MQFSLTKGQLDRLANICEDLAKGNLLAALAGPIIANVFDILQIIAAANTGLIFIYLCLKMEERKESI